MIEQTIRDEYIVLSEIEVQEVVATDLMRYIKCLVEFLKEPDYEDAALDRVKLKHLKAVLKCYITRQEYREFIKNI
jgi:protein-arginine kinase activator protein McsA